MAKTYPGLPRPATLDLQRSEQLTALIKQHIKQADGKITFAAFMEMALYTPNLGYYSANHQKFGPHGDFTTAPELSPLFSISLAQQCQQIIKAIPDATILELGAGSGVMATTILKHLEKLDRLPQQYFILELSADLRQRQQECLKKECPQLLSRVTWLDRLPKQSLNGVILANEVIDAMPIHLFELNHHQLLERYVMWKDEQFQWLTGPVSEETLHQNIQDATKHLKPFDDNTVYQSEMLACLPAWLKSLNTVLNRGIILMIDYGFPQYEYYHPERQQGTLMCHYRQHAHHDPFAWPGLQDITAHVNFSYLATAATEIGFNLSGFSDQAHFLLSCGLLDNIPNTNSIEQQWQYSQQIKRLTLPSEMGELFKVIALNKNFAQTLLGFTMQNKLHRL